MRSHIKNSKQLNHLAFGLALSFSFSVFGTCDETFAPVVDILKLKPVQTRVVQRRNPNPKSRKYHVACGIRNPSLWNPESSSRNPESRQQLKSGIQVAEDPLQIDPLRFKRVHVTFKTRKTSFISTTSLMLWRRTLTRSES